MRRHFIRSTVLLLLAALGLAACATEPPENHVTLKIAAADNFLPVLRRLAEAYHRRQPWIDLELHTSNTARLFAKDTDKIAQKVGEEAVETVIEGVRGRKKDLALESADLLYHLLVLWADRGLKPQDVWDTLAAREGVSGIAEKKARSQSK